MSDHILYMGQCVFFSEVPLGFFLIKDIIKYILSQM